MNKHKFWQTTPLAQMSREQWESLCDGCAQCCLHKLEDEDSGAIYYTDVVCRFWDQQQGHCSDYLNRSSLVPTCLTLTPDNVQSIDWLPLTCAYRLVAEGKELYDWHPLVSGDRNSVHKASMSIRYRAISEDNVDAEALEEHIVRWVL